MKWLANISRLRNKPSTTIPETHTFGTHCPRALITELTLSEFQFVRAIGHGYASTVFKAIHIPSKTDCVVKVCLKTRLSNEEIRRIRREIKNHSFVYHRHILTFYAAFEDATAFYIVLEYAAQGDLFNYIKRQYAGRMQLSRFNYFVLQPLLHAVAYLHSQGIIHRDIKPENILVDERSIIRLSDFGLSIQNTRERPHSIVGTLEYMPPEVLFHGNKASVVFSEKLDIWAIGVITYECLVGHSPFAARTDDEIRENIKHLRMDLDKVPSAEIRQLIAMCLQSDPAARPTIEELLAHEALRPKLSRNHSSTKRSFSFS